MKKRILSIVLSVTMAAAMLSGCGSAAEEEAPAASETTEDTTEETPAAEEASAEETGEAASGGNYTIGISVLNMTGQFFIELVNAAQQEADAKGCTLMTNDANNDSSTQIDALENFISAGCNAIIVCAVDAEATAPIVAKAKEQGIAVVCLTAKVEGYDAYVGVDEYTLGYTQGCQVGKIVAEKFGTEEKIEAATLNYDLMESVIARKQGIMEGVQEYAPNVEFVADATAGDQEEGMTNTENFLQANPDLRMVCGVSDGAALGAYQAFKAAGKTDPDEYLIAGVDATSEALKLISEGTIYQVSVDQNPKGTGAVLVDTACAILNGESYEKDSIFNLIAVSPENIGDYDIE